MLLEEITTSDLTLLAKALSHMKGIDDWTKLEARAYNREALKEAVRLYNWALHENGGTFRTYFRRLMDLLGTRSAPVTRYALLDLEKTGFVSRNKLIHDLYLAAAPAPSRFEFLGARRDALPFAQAVRILFASLKKLGDVATPGTKEHDANDGLNRNLARGTLVKLGIKPANGSYAVEF